MFTSVLRVFIKRQCSNTPQCNIFPATSAARTHVASANQNTSLTSCDHRERDKSQETTTSLPSCFLMYELLSSVDSSCENYAPINVKPEGKGGRRHSRMGRGRGGCSSPPPPKKKKNWGNLDFLGRANFKRSLHVCSCCFLFSKRDIFYFKLKSAW